ncbi:MAG: hypothetical protein K2O91_12310 [Lachnospiraceae bacterium]|nr:hypothetical protein [Lachnospiraceae bacterium]
MVKLFEQNIRTNERQSSKGNQLKWVNNDIWYKADYTGYEGLAEYVISGLLSHSNLNPQEYVTYQTEKIHYRQTQYRACKCPNFLPESWKLIALERLFQSIYGKSLNKAIYSINDLTDRMCFLVDQTIRITGLKDFGSYMSKLLTVDALFLNEDRHTHNIAVLLDDARYYHYCPIFDNGAALLSDTTMDYPMNAGLNELLEKPRAKTISQDFDEQLDIAEKLYGQHIKFSYSIAEVDALLSNEIYYPDNIKQRVRDLIIMQRRKYQYLF